MFDRRLVTNFDWMLVVLTLLLAAVGITVLYAATYHEAASRATPVYLKQLYWIALGLAAMGVVFLIDYHQIEQYGYLIYAGAVALLIAVLVVGKTAGGSQRWINLGLFNLQPSELAKLGLIIALAKFFHHHRDPKGFTLARLIVPIGLAAGPVVLILAQPDLGTALVLLLIFGSMLMLAKVRSTTLAALLFAALTAAPLFWATLKPYQRARVLTLLQPDKDPLGAGYHIRQSKIAIGSGKLVGKGYLEGTQSHLKFLPEQHTDFIFSVLAEEWGFIGAGGLIALYALFVIWGLRIAFRSRDRFGSFCAVGIVALIFWHVFINIGMVTGLLPVVGMPLPLLSYGGTSVLVFMASIGLLLNVSVRRYA